nr:hypothetical protein [Tanacetum cinerariifolium]
CRSSQGVAAAGDPRSENVSSPTEVGAAEEKSAGLSQELERMRAQFSEIQAFADVVSAGIAKGMSEGLKHGVEHGHAQRTIESLEAYDLEAEAKFAA